MIYTKLNELNRYYNINKNLDTAIRYIEHHSLAELPLGRTDIDENVFIVVFKYQADNILGDFYEGHKKYLDMHIVLSGKEQMAGLSLNNAKEKSPFSEIDDIGFYNGNYEYLLTLENGGCLITFPEDLHQPKIKIDDEIVHKIVVKVKL